ncbi:receptor-like cytosolic serine/threonine-protein kinase RBK2 [Olea europaea var. sylvestris]|uniref:receptor-like cytosolic serine/threonine-protein kinase RBK2 n=1 Tax=Olea europaea var. sylvestris TaxID=158386 RepID=UPI000C1D1944|nr:receptor-like cytosolic serine/threonine-protein kinase RBK2 [Olea europaea var. sylvestris]
MAAPVLQHHHPSRPLKTCNDANTVTVKTLNSNAVLATYKKFTCSLPSSASAQDLRCFEVEKERLDHSSPRGVLEACTRGLENEADLENEPGKMSGCKPFQSISQGHSRWHRFFKAWKRGSTKRLPSFPPLVPILSRRKSRSTRENVENDACPVNSAWKNFTLNDLQTATNNFSRENLIGKGGYAEVYKGCLPDGQLVAIKQLNKGTSDEQTINFLSEIGIIAHVNHPNTAKLIGYGVEGGTYLVLKLSSLGSLGSLLRGSKEKLDWRARYKIILGTADGLIYLHEHCQRRIIHRDIKADNILLTEDFEPQICDFGLAKWLPKQWSHHHISKFEGTFGYFAPEYFMHGIVDEKTDVFSFGVLLLELITGRQALDDSRRSLVLWAKPFLDKNEVKELVDPTLGDNYDQQEMACVLFTATICVEQNPIRRPHMSQVIRLLRGEEKNLNCPKQILRRTYSEELLDAENYNSTKYLVHRPQRIALVS